MDPKGFSIKGIQLHNNFQGIGDGLVINGTNIGKEIEWVLWLKGIIAIKWGNGSTTKELDQSSQVLNFKILSEKKNVGVCKSYSVIANNNHIIDIKNNESNTNSISSINGWLRRQNYKRRMGTNYKAFFPNNKIGFDK